MCSAPSSMKTSLAKIGRARVALALPRQREQLRALEGEQDLRACRDEGRRTFEETVS